MAFKAETKEHLLIVSTEELKLQDTLMQLTTHQPYVIVQYCECVCLVCD
jgi:hypothetical protein